MAAHMITSATTSVVISELSDLILNSALRLSGGVVPPSQDLAARG